jgi:hypothetical protein
MEARAVSRAPEAAEIRMHCPECFAILEPSEGHRDGDEWWLCREHGLWAADEIEPVFVPSAYHEMRFAGAARLPGLEP